MSVLATTSVTCAARVSLSEPEPVAPVGPSVALAVLTSGSVASPAAKATGTVNVSTLAAPATMTAPVAPKPVWPAVPVTVPQFDAPLAAQVALAVSVTPAGSASATVTLLAVDTPLLPTVIVYVALPPGV